MTTITVNGGVPEPACHEILNEAHKQILKNPYVGLIRDTSDVEQCLEKEDSRKYRINYEAYYRTQGKIPEMIADGYVKTFRNNQLTILERNMDIVTVMQAKMRRLFG